ncbi:hypothetical protein [Ornithinimicrobium kibberense]|uniref:hypothetical protein n=1 Tax=Ornithinimicrobium kibberense TaxID=282060 RepID=UPI0036221FAA
MRKRARSIHRCHAESRMLRQGPDHGRPRRVADASVEPWMQFPAGQSVHRRASPT